MQNTLAKGHKHYNVQLFCIVVLYLFLTLFNNSIFNYYQFSCMNKSPEHFSLVKLYSQFFDQCLFMSKPFPFYDNRSTSEITLYTIPRKSTFLDFTCDTHAVFFPVPDFTHSVSCTPYFYMVSPRTHLSSLFLKNVPLSLVQVFVFQAFYK